MATARGVASVTWSQVAAFRLSRHHLLERAPSRALVSVVRNMAGAQAQVLSAAQISLWARVRDLRPANIEAALRARTLVRAACMRSALFLLPSKDLAVFGRGAAWRAERELRWVRGKGIPDRVMEELVDSVLGALDRPLTRQELAECVSRSLDLPQRGTRGAGWGHTAPVPGIAIGDLTFPMVYVLQLVAARGLVCLGPARGNEPTFVRADGWIPGWRDVPPEQAESGLLHRYLQAFGPATPADFALWSGARLASARAIWSREEAGLAPVSVEGWQTAVLREDVPVLTRARLAGAPVRLLPYFDSYLLGHKQRVHLVAAQHHRLVYRAQGWIAPVVLAEGQVAAVWAHAWQGDRLRVTVTPFGPLPRRIRAGVTEEARDLGRFLNAADVDVQIG